MSVDNALFKQLMRQWASGVTVITTLGENGSWVGVTASAFSSVSAAPPLVLVCLLHTLYTHKMLETMGVFAVNVLAAAQLELGKRFAGMTGAQDRFAGLNCATAATGCPLLPHTAAWLDCRVQHAYAAGDHTIFVGEVLAGGVGGEQEPLVYHRQRWGQFAELHSGS